jgi:small-conductance mechanosensitive channel
METVILPMILAQVAAEPFHFQLHDWIPTLRDAIRGGAIALGILVAGLLVYAALRKYILRTRLTAAVLVIIAALAIYFGIGGVKPQRMLDRHDYATLWLTRIFAAAILYSALRALDRLLIVPVLSRGGKAPVQRFIHQIVNIVISVFAIMVFGARVFGWDINAFLAGSAVISIVLGLALQETLGNFFSGLVMQASSPFAIGDWIICGGVEGKVVDMTWRAVTIHTPEDNHVIIPNGTIAKEQIVNFHKPVPATARTVSVGLEGDLPPGDALAVLKVAALETPGVAAKPEPFVFLQEFGDSGNVYQVKFWITEPAAHHRIEHHVRTNIWYRLKGKGFKMPNPTYQVEHIALAKKQRLQFESAAKVRYEALKDLWLFAPLSDEEKHALAAGAIDLYLAPGQVLFHQNDPGESLYVIRKGEVEIWARHGDGTGAGPETKVATLKAGDFFGEMSALTGQPRTATVRAGSDLACVQIGKEDLQAVFSADPAIMEKISRIIAERNAQRQTLTQEAASAAAREQDVSSQQKSLLGRMLRFFGRGA